MTASPVTVVRALNDGDFDLALSMLLQLWGASRAPELAEVIEEASAAVTAQRPKLEAKTRREALATWLEVARRKQPGDVGRLLTDLLKVLAVGPSHLALPRLDELLLLPPDPRIGRALVAAIGGPLSGWSDEAYVRTVKGLLRHGDASLLVPLKKALSRRAADLLTPEDQARFGKVAAAWSKHPEPTPAAGLAEVRAALKTAPAGRTSKQPLLDEESALAAIYAAPEDDAARLVYADLLSTRGDNRGELIVLQVDRAQGRGTSAKDKREKALLKANQTAWLGPLASAAVLKVTQWERGFPVATRTRLAKLFQAEAAFIRPEWATFKRLHFGGAALVTGSMRALEEARGLNETSAKRLAGLAARPPNLSTIELLLDSKRLLLDQPAISAVLSLKSLRALTLRSSDWQDPLPMELATFFTAVSRRLEHLSITGEGAVEGRLFDPILDRPDLTGGLTAIGWGFSEHHEVVARRDKRGWTSLEVTCDVSHPSGVGLTVLKRMLAGVRPGRFEVATLTREADTPAEQLVRRVAKKVERAER